MTATKKTIAESPAALLLAEFGVEIVKSASRELPYLIERIEYGHFKCNACQREFHPSETRWGSRREGTLNFGLASHAKSHILKGEAMDGYRDTPGEYSGGYQYHRCLPSRERCLAYAAAQAREAEVEPQAEKLAALLKPAIKRRDRVQREREVLEGRAITMLRHGLDVSATTIPEKIHALSDEIKLFENQRDEIESEYPADVLERARRLARQSHSQQEK